MPNPSDRGRRGRDPAPLAIRGGDGMVPAEARKTGDLMAGAIVPHFQNDAGVATIEIGVREFKCVGATAPFDHPHIYIDLGDDDVGICPYCSTTYGYRHYLAADQTNPPGHLVPYAAD